MYEVLSLCHPSVQLWVRVFVLDKLNGISSRCWKLPRTEGNIPEKCAAQQETRQGVQHMNSRSIKILFGVNRYHTDGDMAENTKVFQIGKSHGDILSALLFTMCFIYLKFHFFLSVLIEMTVLQVSQWSSCLSAVANKVLPKKGGH